MNTETQKIQAVKATAIEALELVKVYCQTVDCSGYSDKELTLMRSEFEPILNECDKAIRKIAGNK